MTSDVSDVFARFYLKVDDYKLAGLDEEVVAEMLNGYLKATVSQPEVRRLFVQLTLDTDVGEIEYIMRNAWDDASDQDFVEEVLALGMIVAWLSPRYHNTLLTSQMFSNSEQRFYSQSTHMAELKNMFEKAQLDFRRFIRDRGYAVSLVNAD